MSSILKTPWTPVLDGWRCVRYAPYDDSVEEGAIPNVCDNPGWDLDSLESEFAKTPQGKDALWEGILALWRLNLTVGEGTNNENWQNLVSAWLVRNCRSIVAIGIDGIVTQYRHRDLCWHLGIGLYKIISEYDDSLCMTQNLPVHMIPSWDKPDAEPQPESTPRPKRQPK